MHIVITGGTGYIGRHVVQMALQRGHRVTLLGPSDGRGTRPPLAPGRSGAASGVGQRSDHLGEIKNAPGVHVVDGAALPAMAARNPTLTIMANADRVGTALAMAWRK